MKTKLQINTMVVFLFFTTFLFVRCGSSKVTKDVANESLNQSYEKARLDNIKAKIAEYKDEGWRIDDTYRTMEFAFREHEQRLRNGNKEINISIDLCSEEECYSDAITEAQRYYIQKATAEIIDGGIAGGKDKINNQTSKKILGKYVLGFKGSVAGILEQSLALIKKNGGGYSYKSVFLCNNDKALNLRLEAMKKALEEVDISEKIRKKIIEAAKVNPLK